MILLFLLPVCSLFFVTLELMNNCLRIKSMLRRDTNNAEAIVLPLILYSDSTTLTQTGNQSIWPVYMTLANIPVHRRTQAGCFQLLGFLPEHSVMCQFVFFFFFS